MPRRSKRKKMTPAQPEEFASPQAQCIVLPDFVPKSVPAQWVSGGIIGSLEPSPPSVAISVLPTAPKRPRLHSCFDDLAADILEVGYEDEAENDGEEDMG